MAGDTWDRAAQPSRESSVRTRAHLRLLEFQPTCRCMSEKKMNACGLKTLLPGVGVLGGVIIQQMTDAVGYDMTPV